jgi:hypothetical protein
MSFKKGLLGASALAGPACHAPGMEHVGRHQALGNAKADPEDALRAHPKGIATTWLGQQIRKSL